MAARILAVLTAFFLIFAGQAFALSWQEAVYHYAKLYNLNPCVVFAVIDTESSGNPNAITVNYHNRYRSYKTRRSALKLVKSRYGNMDIGLMQINYYWTRQELKITKAMLLNPVYNIDIGEWILKELLKKYGNYTEAVMRYHSSDYAKGLRYVKKVIKAYQNDRWFCRREKDDTTAEIAEK